MSDVKLMVLYPVPSDTESFDKDYREHLAMLHAKMSIPVDERPYTLTKFNSSPESPAPYYQMFCMGFPSLAALNEVMASDAMQEVAADAVRISSGGAPVILVGNEVIPKI